MVPRVDNGELQPTCLECLPGALATEEEYSFQLHPDQQPELRSLGILEYAQEFVERMNQQRKG